MKTRLCAALGVTLALTVPASASAAPVASFVVEPAQPVAGQAAQFDATGSTPDEDAIVTYEWDFQNDGTPDATGAEVTFTYPTAGERYVRLTVTDDGAVPESDEILVPVGPAPPNALPVVQLARSPAQPVAGQAVTFQSFSYDPDGGSLIHAWDIDGDGFDDGTGATLVRAFPAGSRTVRLRVTDNEGPPVIGQVAFNVVAAPANPLPVAQFAVSPLDPVVGQAVTLQSYSYDPQGSAVTHAWDLDNDGAFDDGTGSSANTRFNAAGTRVVRLRVTDAAGGQQIASRTVRVAPTPLTRLGAKIRIAGTFRKAGTRLYAFKVESAIGSSISVKCRGKKCPFTVLRREADKRRVRLAAAQRFYPAGVMIIVRVEAEGRIGDYTRWRVRAGKVPERTDLCLQPGAKRPNECP